MIRVTVELLSAIHPSRNRVMAMMHIANDGRETLVNPRLGTYDGETFVGRDAQALSRGQVSKRGRVERWPREAFHVWNLVARMLESMGYDKGKR